MSSGSSWSWWGSGAPAGAAEFERIVEKCTSENSPSSTPPSITDALDLSDLLRSSAISPSAALKALRRRLTHPNPNVQLLAVSIIDICIKNGGDGFLKEAGAREFADEVGGMVRSGLTNREVRDKLRRELQNWALAFEAVPALSGSELVAQYRRLKYDGIDFPPRDPSATAAMVDSMSAPEWRDSDVCERCRTPFSFTNRKHHCRNCGGVFDGQCSSKKRTLPHYGVSQELVRVCDGCDRKLAAGQIGRRNSVAGGDTWRENAAAKGNGLGRASTFNGSRAPQSSYHRYSLSTPDPVKSSSAAVVRKKEDDDLARAIALSLEESAPLHRPGYAPSYASHPSEAAPFPSRKEEEDPDLAAAIAASLREAEPSRPAVPSSATTSGPPKRPPLPSYDLTPAEEDSINSFANDLESALASGRMDPGDRIAVARYGEMHDRAVAARPQLLRGLGDADRKTQALQEMNDKLGQAVRLYDQLLEEQLAYRTQSSQYLRGSQRPAPSYAPSSPRQRPQSAFYGQPAASSYQPLAPITASALHPSLNPALGPPYTIVPPLASPHHYQQQHAYRSDVPGHYAGTSKPLDSAASPHVDYEHHATHSQQQYIRQAHAPNHVPQSQDYHQPAEHPDSASSYNPLALHHPNQHSQDQPQHSYAMQSAAPSPNPAAAMLDFSAPSQPAPKESVDEAYYQTFPSAPPTLQPPVAQPVSASQMVHAPPPPVGPAQDPPVQESAYYNKQQPYSHYTLDSFPSAPRTEIVTADQAWAVGREQYPGADYRAKEEPAPLIEL